MEVDFCLKNMRYCNDEHLKLQIVLQPWSRGEER